MKIKDTLIVLFIVGAMSLVANAIGTKYTIVEAIPGLLFLIFFGQLPVLFWQNICRDVSLLLLIS